MRAKRNPGRPITSEAPRKPPRKIAPAKLEAKGREKLAQAKVDRQKHKRQANSAAIDEHLEAVAAAHRKQKAGPSALDPAKSAETPMQRTQGNSKKNKKNSMVRLMQLSAMAIMSHPFGAQLASWTTGVAVDCGAEWTREAVDLAIERGPHPTATAEEAMALVREDVDYQVQAGFTEVFYWDELKDDLPPHFKVSPVAVIPQTGRRGRIILDLSFPVRRPPQKGSGTKRKMGEVIAPSVNETTSKLAPTEPVHAIGKVLPRLFHFMADTPADQEIRLSKVDLSDGFWRVLVEPSQKWNFCYVMPDPPGSRVRIVVPSALQMGWAESPAYFCAATETGRDIIDLLLRENAELPEHPLETFMQPSDLPRTAPNGEEHTSIGVYVDDYVLGVVENEDRTLIRRVSRATLHAIHSIFPPPEVSGHVGGKDPISRKKLEKGDARFEVEKEILGFLLNGVERTVRLSEAKAQAIAADITAALRKTHVPLKRFRSLLGRLQHAARILPAAKGLFSPLNKATKGDPKEVGLGKHSEVRAALLDLRHLVLTLGSRPTHVAELVEYEPELAGTCDASATGAGGVWVGYGIQPTVWRTEWPADVVQLYRTGALTNSDLEMAAVLMQYLVAEQLRPMEHCHTSIWSDNSPTTSWSTKMADKATTPIAGQLLRALAMRQRTTRSALPTVTHYAGSLNLLADTASRSFRKFHHGNARGDPSCSDTDFLTAFNSVFSLSDFSQMPSWQIVTLTSEMNSLVISTLRGQKLAMPRWTVPPEPPTGTTGVRGANDSDLTSSSVAPPATSMPTSSWLSLPESVLALLVTANKLGANPSPRPCAMSPRPSFWPATATLGEKSTAQS
jgi:hypothetical protein